MLVSETERERDRERVCVEEIIVPVTGLSSSNCNPLRSPLSSRSIYVYTTRYSIITAASVTDAILRTRQSSIRGKRAASFAKGMFPTR